MGVCSAAYDYGMGDVKFCRPRSLLIAYFTSLNFMICTTKECYKLRGCCHYGPYLSRAKVIVEPYPVLVKLERDFDRVSVRIRGILKAYTYFRKIVVTNIFFM